LRFFFPPSSPGQGDEYAVPEHFQHGLGTTVAAAGLRRAGLSEAPCAAELNLEGAECAADPRVEGVASGLVLGIERPPKKWIHSTF